MEFWPNLHAKVGVILCHKVNFTVCGRGVTFSEFGVKGLRLSELFYSLMPLCKFSGTIENGPIYGWFAPYPHGHFPQTVWLPDGNNNPTLQHLANLADRRVFINGDPFLVDGSLWNILYTGMIWRSPQFRNPPEESSCVAASRYFTRHHWFVDHPTNRIRRLYITLVISV